MMANRLQKVRLCTGFQRNAVSEVTAAASAGDTAGCTFQCWVCGA